MIIIATENISERLSGYLTRLFIEIKRGVFIGNYSVKVKDNIKEKIIENIKEGSIAIAWTANNESGFDFEIIGDDKKSIIDFDGIKLTAQ